MEKRKIKRALAIKFNDGTPDIELEISSATRIRTPKQMMILEQKRDGSFMLNVTESLIHDFSKVKSFEMIRED